MDMVHRVAIPRKKQDDPSLPFIAWILHYQNKECIMKLAREAGSLSFRGSEISIYPDYSAEVSKERATYSTVNSQLSNASFRYWMFFHSKSATKTVRNYFFLSQRSLNFSSKQPTRYFAHSLFSMKLTWLRKIHSGDAAAVIVLQVSGVFLSPHTAGEWAYVPTALHISMIFFFIRPYVPTALCSHTFIRVFF